MLTRVQMSSQLCPPANIILKASIASSILIVVLVISVCYVLIVIYDIRGLQSELYLPFGPKDIPRRIPRLGIEMKYIGHIATHRVSTPNMPTKDDSKLTFSLTLLWYFSFFYLQSQHILTVEFCTSWHIFPQTHFSVHEKTATNDELYLADAVIFITLPEKWWQMQLQW